MSAIKLVECPRDAMQGIKQMIDTDTKVRYMNQLLQVGFDTLDFGSFVSPKVIPQMADTVEVLNRLDLSQTQTKLLAIIANERGAEEAASHAAIRYLGYPFSVSETFQLRNTNATIKESLERVKAIQRIAEAGQKEVVIYISMGFGNPYGDEWNVGVVQGWVNTLADMGVKILSLSDTIGVANAETIAYLFGNLIPPHPEVEFGAHLHTHAHNWREKIEAAYSNGCKRFDAALRGFGGCPMATDDLTGNMPMENLLGYFADEKVDLGLNTDAFQKAMLMTDSVFGINAH